MNIYMINVPFSTKIVRHTYKQESMSHIQKVKQSIKTVHEVAQTLGLLIDRDFESTIKNMYKF